MSGLSDEGRPIRWRCSSFAPVGFSRSAKLPPRISGNTRHGESGSKQYLMQQVARYSMRKVSQVRLGCATGEETPALVAAERCRVRMLCAHASRGRRWAWLHSLRMATSRCIACSSLADRPDRAFFTASGNQDCVDCRGGRARQEAEEDNGAAAGQQQQRRTRRTALSPRSPNSAAAAAAASSSERRVVARCADSSSSTAAAAGVSSSSSSSSEEEVEADSAAGLGGWVYSTAAGMLGRLASQ